MLIRHRFLKTIIVSGSLLVGCGSSLPDYSCAQIPCITKLTLRLTGQTAETYTIKLRAPQKTFKVEEVFTCPRTAPQQPFDAKKPFADYSCTGDTIVIPNYAEEQIEVSYQGGDKFLTQTIKPAYIDQQPSADHRCGKCIHGEAALTL